jgi:hypothetical protein
VFGLGGPEILILAFLAIGVVVVVLVVKRANRRPPDRGDRTDDRDW